MIYIMAASVVETASAPRQLQQYIVLFFIIQSLTPSPVFLIQDLMVPGNRQTVTTVLPSPAPTMARELPREVTNALCCSRLGNFYYSVVPLDLPTSRQRRSEDDNNQPSIHSFMFVGKPTSNHRHDNMSDSDYKSGSNSSHESSSDSDSYHNEAERRSSQSRQGPEQYVEMPMGRPNWDPDDVSSEQASDDHQHDNHDNSHDNRSDSDYHSDDDSIGNNDHRQHRSADDDEQSNMHFPVAEQLAATARGNIREEEIDFIGNDDHRQHRSADDDDQSNIHSAVAAQLAAITTNEKIQYFMFVRKPTSDNRHDNRSDSAYNSGIESGSDSSKRTRHIHIRYFFVTDRVKGNELEIQYCPTKEMLGDFFTKPLTGPMFAKFRNNILGITEEEYKSYKEEYYKAKANNVTTKTNSG